MKIVILNDMLWGGGRERRIVQLIAGLNKLGYKKLTLILLDERVDYPEIFDMDVEVIRIKRSSSRDLSVFPKLYRILKDIKPDVINPWSYMTTFYASPLAALLKVKCVGSFVVDAKSPPVFSVNWPAMKLGFLLCRKIVANSMAGHKAYRTPVSKRVVVYNGFNEARISDAYSEQCLAAVNDPPVISMIGRMDPQKDFHTYIDSLALLKQRGVRFQAYMVGQGPMSQELDEYATAHCPDSISLTGFLRDVDSHIRSVDIGVLCTDPDSHAEGISNAILEFMAHGKPVVATNGGGTPEIIEDGVSGVMVSAKCATELADRLQFLIENKEIRSSMGFRGKQIVAEKFSLMSMARRFEELYRA